MAVCENRDSRFYINITEEYISRPAVLIDLSSNALLKFGEEELVSKVADKLKSAFDSAQLSNNIVVIALDKLNVNEQAYVVNRMLECTASDFIPDFVNHQEDVNLDQWLESEMGKVGIQ